MEYDEFLSARARDRRGASIRLETAGVGEASGVVANLGQQTCRGQLAQPREAGEDGHLWMLLKDESGCLGEVIGRLSGGLELFEQCQRLVTHRMLNQLRLMQPGASEDRLESNAGGSNSTLPAGAPKRGLQLWPSQAGGLSWSRRDCQDGAGIRM